MPRDKGTHEGCPYRLRGDRTPAIFSLLFLRCPYRFRGDGAVFHEILFAGKMIFLSWHYVVNHIKINDHF